MSRRIFRARRAASLLVLLAAAGCSSGPESGSVAPAAQAPAVQQTPVAPPVPVRPANFAFAGELTQGGWLKGTAPAGAVEVSLGAERIPLARDGVFFLAFDRDAGPATTLAARLADGSMVTRTLVVAPRGWELEHVNIGRRAGGASEAFMRIRRPELARIAAARAVDTGSQGWRQDFIWPVKGRISGRFGSQRIYLGEPGSYHSGVDVTTGESGTPFVAPADGVVILAAESPFTLEGRLLMIDHGMGLNSAFLHCSELLVSAGQTVRRGQVIGRIGMTGRATGPHLHWSIKWRNARLDPILFTGPMR